MTRKKYTATDKLLLAAHDLEVGGRRPFAAEDLVVRAWELFPESFSLAGHRAEDGVLKYPDSNRVFMEIMGSKPIRKRGFLVKVGNKMYELTEAGRDAARAIAAGGSRATAPRSGLSRDVKDELRKLLNSRAAIKFKNDRLDDITFHDACAFWGISPRSDAKQLRGRFANLTAVIRAAHAAVRGSNENFDEASGAFGSRDLDALLNVHHALQEKFKEELSIIESRTDERL